VAVKRFWLAPALLVGVVLYAALDADSGLRAWLQLRTELRESHARADAIQAEIDRLDAAARALHGDAFAMEAAIREDLGLARAGESVVLFAGPDGSTDRNP